MKLLQVKISKTDEKYLQPFQNLLHIQYKALTLYGIYYRITYQYDHDEILISCQFWASTEYTCEMMEVMIHLTSQAIAEYVLIYKENDILDDILMHEYGFHHMDTRSDILAFIYFMLNTDELGDDCSQFRKEQMKIKISEKVSGCFWLDNQLFLEGFIRFRLKDQWGEWRHAIEHAIDEYLMDKEYREYTKLLQGFVSKQDHQIHQLHLIHIDDRNLLLYNEYWERIYSYLTNGISLEISGKCIRYEDLLLSVLLSLAPSLLILHTNQESHHIIYTLKKIFKENIDICSSCPDCQRLKNVPHSPACRKSSEK